MACKPELAHGHARALRRGVNVLRTVARRVCHRGALPEALRTPASMPGVPTAAPAQVSTTGLASCPLAWRLLTRLPSSRNRGACGDARGTARGPSWVGCALAVFSRPPTPRPCTTSPQNSPPRRALLPSHLNARSPHVCPVACVTAPYLRTRGYTSPTTHQRKCPRNTFSSRHLYRFTRVP